MTHDPMNHGDRPQPPMALEYGKPSAGLPYGWQAALGALIACGSILGVALLGIVAGMVGIILFPLLLVVTFVSTGLLLRRYDRSRGWAAGLFIGTCVAVLIDGLCWAALSNVRIGG